MVRSITGGFNALIQISESSVNILMDFLFYVQQLFHIGLPIQERIENLDIKLVSHFDKPQIRFRSSDTHDNPITIILPFSNSPLTISAGTFSRVLASTEGEFRILDGLSFIKNGDNRVLKIDFKDNAPGPIFFHFSESSNNQIEKVILEIRNTQGENFANLTLESFWAEMESKLSHRISNFLSNTIGEIPIPPTLRVNSTTTDSNTVKDIDFKLAYDVLLDKGALSYFITFGGSKPGDLQSFDKYLIVPFTYDLALVVSNRYILEKHIIARIEDELGIPNGFEGNPVPGYFLKNPVNRGPIRITGLGVSVSNDGFYVITIAGRDNGIKGADVSFQGEIKISFELGFNLESFNQDIRVKIDYELNELTIDLEWWVYLLGYIFFGPIGALVIFAVDEAAEFFARTLLDMVIEPIIQTIEKEPIVSTPEGFGYLIGDISIDDLMLLGWPLSMPYSIGRILQGRGISRPVSLLSVGSKHGLVPPFRLSHLVKRLS